MSQTTASSSPASTAPQQTKPGADPFWSTPGGAGVISVIVIVVVGVIIFIAVWFGLKAGGGGSGNNITFNFTSPAITAGGVLSATATFTLDPNTFAAKINFPTTLIPIANTYNVYGLVAPAGTNTFPSSMAPATASVTGTTTATLTNSSASSSSSTSSPGVAMTVHLYADGSMFLLPTDGVTSFGPASGTTEVTINSFSLSYTATSTPVTLTYGNVPNFFFNASFLNGSSATTLYYSTNSANSQVMMIFPSLGISTGGTAGSTVTSDTVLPNSPTKLIPASTVTNTLESAYNAGTPNANSVSIDMNGNVTLTNTTGNFAINQTSDSYGTGFLQYSL